MQIYWLKWTPHVLCEIFASAETMQSFYFSIWRSLLSLSFSSRSIISPGGSWSWAPQVLLWLKTLLTVIRRPGAHHSRLFILARCQIYLSVSPVARRSCFSHTWKTRKWSSLAVHVITFRIRLLIFFFFSFCQYVWLFLFDFTIFVTTGTFVLHIFFFMLVSLLEIRCASSSVRTEWHSEEKFPSATHSENSMMR